MTVAGIVFSSQAYVNSNVYTKTDVDGLVSGGGGSTDAQIDAFLSLKEAKSTFADIASCSPVIHLSRPSEIHQGLASNN